MATLLSNRVETAPDRTKEIRPEKSNFKLSRWALGAGVLVIVVGLTVWFRGGKTESTGTTFVVRRGPLPITVLEGGSIEARESQEIRSEIKGYQGAKILSIVEEGYLVTEEDVKNGKVLVELDSSEIKQRIVTQDIQFQSTRASLIEAQQSYDIQVNQNQSDLNAAELKVRFARMDLEKYLGNAVTKEILEQLARAKEPGSTSTNGTKKAVTGLIVPALPAHLQFAAAMSPKLEGVSNTKPPPTYLTNGLLRAEPAASLGAELTAQEMEGLDILPKSNPIVIDFSKYAKSELLGDGAAQQQLRKLEDDALVADSEQKMAQTKFEGSQRLFDKLFLTKNEFENDRLTVEKASLKVKTARTALGLFIKYEFTKAAEEFLSKYDEAIHAFERALKETISKLAQSRAKLRSSEARFRIEDVQQKEIYEQLGKCTLRALKPGLVVYGGGGDRRFYSGEDQIREGATVRERQPIITIPDMTQMSVRVKIHESHIKKIKKGMKARIQVDAFSDKHFTGDVSKVGVLPDSQDRWMNPDLKVYLTTIDIEGVHDWVKPGMSAKVEIEVNRLEDVVYVPIQAITPSAGKHLCYVVNGAEPESREVEIGEFNDEFIEIKKGLKEGQRVLLRAPEGAETGNEVNGPTTDKSQPGQARQTSGDKEHKAPAKPQREVPPKPGTPGMKLPSPNA